MTEKEQKKSFAFVLNHIDVEGKLPVEVAPGHFFEKADVEKIEKIKKYLDLLRPFGPHRIINIPSPYEVNIVRVSSGKPGSFSTKYESLPEDRWRYYIISFKGSNKELQHIGRAASLLEHDLELGFTILREIPVSVADGFTWHGASLFSFFDQNSLGSRPHITIRSDELCEIRENYDLIKKISPEHEHIKRAFRKFQDLKSLPRTSELEVIGLFSIIESLITHCPKLSESSDSLMHQIKTKIPLLSKRFQRNLNYGAYFGEISEVNAWAKLYGYRSQIVHGEHSDLHGSLQVLKDGKIVIEFLKETVKLLLLLALREPVLLTDLKNC